MFNKKKPESKVSPENRKEKVSDASKKEKDLQKNEGLEENQFDRHERDIIRRHEGYDVEPNAYVTGFPDTYAQGKKAFEHGLNPEDDGGTLD